jgi:hypothetical protein
MLTTENPPQTAEQINASQVGQIDISNEHPGENRPDNQNTTFEKLRTAVSGVVGKWKPGRGRPRKDGSPKKSDVALEIQEPISPPSENLVSTPVNSAVDSLFRRSIVSGAKGVLGFLKSLVRIKADAAGLEEKFVSKTLSECEPEPEVLDNFSESLKICLEKWNVKSEHAPEISLAINSARLVAPYALLFVTFNAEIKRRRELETKQTGQA